MQVRQSARILLRAMNRPCSVELCEASATVNDVKRPWPFGQRRDFSRGGHGMERGSDWLHVRNWPIASDSQPSPSPQLVGPDMTAGLDRQSQGASERSFKLSKGAAPLPQVRSLMGGHQTSDAQCGQPSSLPRPRASARRPRRDTIPSWQLRAGWQDWMVKHGSTG